MAGKLQINTFVFLDFLQVGMGDTKSGHSAVTMPGKELREVSGGNTFRILLDLGGKPLSMKNTVSAGYTSLVIPTPGKRKDPSLASHH